MDKRTLALLKVHGTAVFFGASGIFGALIHSSAETIVLGRVMIAFTMISLYFLWKTTACKAKSQTNRATSCIEWFISCPLGNVFYCG